jgi:hypothetical protein
VTYARWLFRIAGIYGLLTVAPMLFLEKAVAGDTGWIGHPEYFYGWIVAALVFQLMFLVIASDPARFRPLIPIAILEKFTWIAALWTLAAQGRVPPPTLVIGSLDAVWGVLFVIAWIRTRPQSA